MRSKLANITAGLLALIAVVLVCLWLRSYWSRDKITYVEPLEFYNYSESYQLFSRRGVLEIAFVSEYLDDRFDRVLLGNKAIESRLGYEQEAFKPTWLSLFHDHFFGLGDFELRSEIKKTRDTTYGHRGYVEKIKEDRFMIFPYWAPILVVGAWPIVRVFRRKHRLRRRRLNAALCGECGYDVRASVDECPECGATLEKLASEE